jgi:hypothetical protein
VTGCKACHIAGKFSFKFSVGIERPGGLAASDAVLNVRTRHPARSRVPLRPVRGQEATANGWAESRSPAGIYFVGNGGDDVVRRIFPAAAPEKKRENEYGCEKKITTA